MIKNCFQLFVLTCWLGAGPSVCQDANYTICNFDALVNSPRLKIRSCTNFTVSSSSMCVVECEQHYLPKPSALSFCVNGYFTEIRCVFIDVVVKMCEDEKNHCPYEKKDFIELSGHHIYPEKVLLFRHKGSFIPIKVIPPDKDINECDSETPFHDCVAMATCKNTNGSFACVCPNGFEGNGRTNGNGCSDINECDANTPTHDCVAMANCNNNNGSFTCTCPHGFVGNGRTSGSGCADKDECNSEAPSHDCVTMATCNNNDGSFTCVCPNGFGGDGRTSGNGCSGVNLTIVGSRWARRHEFPYQAALVASKPDTKAPYLCGGTLIHPVWVLTSAFCVSNINNLLIFVGVWNISKTTDIVDNTTFFTFAQTTIVHPCYQPSFVLSLSPSLKYRFIFIIVSDLNVSALTECCGTNFSAKPDEQDMFTGANLGLAKLLQPATGITPACLPTSFYTDWHRLERGEYLRNCVATGFGKTSIISSNGSEILQKVRVSNVSTTNCNEAYKHYVSSDKICAFGNYDRDKCGGDAGGPLICRSSIGGACSESYLAGVTVDGSSNCGDSRFPEMFTAVFPHVDWINLMMREEPSSTLDRDPTTNPVQCSNVPIRKHNPE